MSCTPVHVEQVPDDEMRGALAGFGMSATRVETAWCQDVLLPHLSALWAP